MLIQILLFFAFIFELALALALIFGLKIADDIILDRTSEFEKAAQEIIDSIKEIKELLEKINKILNLLKKEKIELLKRIINQALGFIDILMLFSGGGIKGKYKAGKFIGLKLLKAILLGLKIYNA